ncbi:hypothetical protein EI94DRAFT_1724441, partial [Lactarius quietus]
MLMTFDGTAPVCICFRCTTSCQSTWVLSFLIAMPNSESATLYITCIAILENPCCVHGPKHTSTIYFDGRISFFSTANENPYALASLAYTSDGLLNQHPSRVYFVSAAVRLLRHAGFFLRGRVSLCIVERGQVLAGQQWNSCFISSFQCCLQWIWYGSFVCHYNSNDLSKDSAKDNINRAEDSVKGKQRAH